MREHLAITQGALASQCAMSQVQVHAIETGRSAGSIAALRALSSALCCSADDLMSVPSEQRLAEIKVAYARHQLELAEAQLPAASEAKAS